MAESATFTANLQYHPSIFEITASEFLDNILYPALSKFCDFFGWNLTLKSKYFNFTEDISPAITLALQYFYLKKRDSSFGEAFYGLHRTDSNNKPLKNRFTSAILLILLPFLEKKLKTRAANHQNESKIEKICLNGFHIFQILKAINILLYLAKISSTHSPIFKILGLQLSYSQTSKENTTSLMLKSIEFFAFFLQFIQWWYSRPDRKVVGSLTNPPCYENKEINLIVNSNEMCPICFQKLSLPTTCSISGYVFCWKCIALHLKNKKKCPVTNLPMNVEDLVRIYEN